MLKITILLFTRIANITISPDYLDNDDDDSLDGNEGTEGQTIGLFSNHTKEGDYEVQESPVQKRVIHFFGERIDARNRMNV